MAKKRETVKSLGRKFRAEQAKVKKQKIEIDALKEEKREMNKRINAYSSLVNRIYDYCSALCEASQQALDDGGFSPSKYGEHKGIVKVACNVTGKITKAAEKKPVKKNGGKVSLVSFIRFIRLTYYGFRIYTLQIW